MRKEKKGVAMKIKKSLLLLVTFIVIIMLALPVFFIFIMNYKPLLPATEWQVKAGTHSGKPVPAKIYRMLGQKMPLLVRVDGGKDTSFYSEYFKNYRLGEPRWFAAFISNDEAVITETGVKTFPYLSGNFNPKFGYGVDILFTDKNGELWFLSRAGESVVFSNKAIFVSVSKKDSP